MSDIKKEFTKVKCMEHFDQKESNGNAATRYIIEFTDKVNCKILWKILDEALIKYQKENKNAGKKFSKN